MFCGTKTSHQARHGKIFHFFFVQIITGSTLKIILPHDGENKSIYQMKESWVLSEVDTVRQNNLGFPRIFGCMFITDAFPNCN